MNNKLIGHLKFNLCDKTRRISNFANDLKKQIHLVSL